MALVQKIGQVTWYDKEHLPALAAVPGCLCARRFKAEGGTHRYIALYHLAGPEVTTTQAWRDTRRTPWTKRVGPSTCDHMRFLLRRYVRDA